MSVRIYCGTKRLPSGYGRYGTRYECLQCGYGSAMSKYSGRPKKRGRPRGCFRPGLFSTSGAGGSGWMGVGVGMGIFLLTLFITKWGLSMGWLDSLIWACVLVLVFTILVLIYRAI